MRLTLALAAAAATITLTAPAAEVSNLIQGEEEFEVTTTEPAFQHDGCVVWQAGVQDLKVLCNIPRGYRFSEVVEEPAENGVLQIRLIPTPLQN